MLTPGVTLVSGRLPVTIGAGVAPNFFNEGIGFMTNGSVAIDSNAPAGAGSDAGFRQSAAGALYGTTTLAGTDIWIAGLRCSLLGQIVYEAAAAVSYVNGNPLTAAGVLAVI